MTRVEKPKFEDLLMALSENYGAIYYIDFDEDIVIPYRMSEAIKQSFGKYLCTLTGYEASIDGYIDTIVSEKDKVDLRRVTRYYFLREQLRDKIAYSHEYRVERGGAEYTFRFKIANLDGVGELRRAVMGFADVSDEKRTETKFLEIGRKVLIVDDIVVNRTILKDMVEKEYEVIEATDGKEAIEVLGESYKDIAVVITDLHMPNVDGYGLVKHMKNVRQYANIPVIVASASSINSQNEVAFEVKCLELGAADIIRMPYKPEIVLNRIKSLIRLRESVAMLNSLEKDPLTRLLTKEFFFKDVEKLLVDHPDENYVMWVSDIQGLKIINEKYGIEKGDEVLKCMAESQDKIFSGFVVGGRIEGDKFAAIIREEGLEDAIANIESHPTMNYPVRNVVIKHGFYRIENNTTITAQGMYDRALIALMKIKNRYGVNIAEYNDDIRKDMLTQRLLLENADIALREHQFKVFYQPKHDLRLGKTGGAEGLVRWIHPELGFMDPGVFIPLFEQNGFITKMDFYVWEQVCKDIQEWKSKGIDMVPISINVSRRDFEVDDLAERVIELVDGYGIDHSMFHIEVTESAYSDNPERIVEIIEKFHDNGFVVELDDFGAGYSSMTALSKLDLDVMKLDMSIIRNDVIGSEKNILEFSMQLAKMMNLKTVAEGVETKEQSERILNLGGDYIQGYFYSKPLPKELFEEYITNEHLSQQK